MSLVVRVSIFVCLICLTPRLAAKYSFLNGCRILSGPTFQFLIGPDRTVFNVHSKLAVRLSPVFGALINGGMVESRKQVAILGDIDEEVFGRFCEYAYTGNFSVPAPKMLDEHPLLPPSQNERPVFTDDTSLLADKQPSPIRK